MASTQDSSLSASETPAPVVARVLLSIHLTDEPKGDLVAFLKDEGLIPQYVSGMEIIVSDSARAFHFLLTDHVIVQGIEDIHISNSTLAIVSVPIEIWDLLPEEAPCTYVGIVYSENLLIGQHEDYLRAEHAGHATAGTPAYASSSTTRHALVVQELRDLQRMHNDLKDKCQSMIGDKKILVEAKSRLELRCADLERQLTRSSEAEREPVKDNQEVRPKGILKPFRAVPFPEDLNPTREGVAPLKEAGKEGVPSNARWTKINRKIVNPAALIASNERFEERDDHVRVLRVLSREEIEKLVEKTLEIRGKYNY